MKALDLPADLLPPTGPGRAVGADDFLRACGLPTGDGHAGFLRLLRNESDAVRADLLDRLGPLMDAALFAWPSATGPRARVRRLTFCLVTAGVHQHQRDAAQWLLRHLGASTPGQLPQMPIEKAMDYAIGLAEHEVQLTPQVLGDRVHTGDIWLGAALACEAAGSMLRQIAAVTPTAEGMPADAPDTCAASAAATAPTC